MKISRITNYKELKEEKARLKEKLELNEALIKADVEAFKSSFSFVNILRNAGSFLLSNGRGVNVMNTGFQLGMQVIPFFFRRKSAANSIKYSIIERATLALAPKLLDLAGTALTGLLSKTTHKTISHNAFSETAAGTDPAVKSVAVKTTYPT